MSISVYVAAQCRITEGDKDLINAYNSLVSNRIDPPQELKDKIAERLGHMWQLKYNDIIKIKSDFVEKGLSGDGDVMRGHGEIIKVSDIPDNAEFLRVYSIYRIIEQNHE